MAIPNGKPATDFSAMNREYIRSVAKEEAAAGGSGIPAPANPSNGDVLTYDSTEGAWVADTPDLGLIVNMTYTAEAATLDKTWKEISDATNAGKPVRFYGTVEQDGIIMITAYTYYTCSHSSDPSDPLFGITVHVPNNELDFQATTENDYPVMYL